jgi:hypothetical protein
MLIKYQQLARRLLNDATFARVNDFDLRDYINIGRGQIALQGNAIPGYGTLDVGPASQQYPFSAIDFGAIPGVSGAIAIETINYDTPGGGQQPINPIDWARFNRYELGHSTVKPSPPRVWTQFGQGQAGTLWINALDGPYTLSIKADCNPVDLVDDTTPEALPYMWTDAVPWFAAFYWYAGTGQNPQAAQGMLQVFQQFMQMARGGATPSTLPGVFTGSPDPLMAGRLGLSSGPGRSAQPRQQTPPTAA